MSFSSKSKNDLARIRNESPSCQKAQLSAIIRMNGVIELSGFKHVNIRISSENSAVARLIFILIKKNYNTRAEVSVKKNETLHKNNTYMVLVEDAMDLLEDLGIMQAATGPFNVSKEVPEYMLKTEDERRAFLRGTYIGGGSMSDPEKIYHLELVAHNATYAASLKDFLVGQYQLNAKVIMRKNNHVVYIKEADHIADFLGLIGAHSTLLKFEDIRIMKQMRNDVNRVVNCETANLNKTIDAAYEQIKSIEYIDEVLGLDKLPAKLEAVAILRLANPDATLKELSDLTEPKISKSGVNHRLKKLEKFAEELKQGGEN